MEANLPMKLSKNIALLSLSLGTLLAVSGCDDAAEGAAAEAAPKEVLPNIAVELPPTPNFDEGKAPEKWDDGSYSIFGLRSKIDENLAAGESGTEIWIKGYVQDIYVPTECPEGQLCPPSKQPHFWITDSQGEGGKKRALMIVSYAYQIPEWEMEQWKDVPQVVIEKDKQYKIKGVFKRFSNTGFAHDNGLVDFVSYMATDPETGAAMEVWPPGSPVHPSTLALQEEQMAKDIERMNDAAKKKGG
jgi:hypothetical protein